MKAAREDGNRLAKEAEEKQKAYEKNVNKILDNAKEISKTIENNKFLNPLLVTIELATDFYYGHKLVFTPIPITSIPITPIPITPIPIKTIQIPIKTYYSIVTIYYSIDTIKRNLNARDYVQAGKDVLTKHLINVGRDQYGASYGHYTQTDIVKFDGVFHKQNTEEKTYYCIRKVDDHKCQIYIYEEEVGEEVDCRKDWLLPISKFVYQFRDQLSSPPPV